MARIQILELPVVLDGDDVTTPFVIIIDGVDTTEVRTHTGILVSTDVEQFDIDAIKAATGARGVIIHPGTLDLP